MEYIPKQVLFPPEEYARLVRYQELLPVRKPLSHIIREAVNEKIERGKR